MGLNRAYPSFKIRRGPGLSPAYGTAGQLSPAYGIGFNIYDLFSNSQEGSFYSFQNWQDENILYTDSTGSTVATSIGDQIGMMLDTRLGLVRGGEELTNGDFSDGTTGWAATNASFTVTDGVATVTSTASAEGLIFQAILTAGEWYEVTVTVTASSDNNASVSVGGARSALVGTGTFTRILRAASTSLQVGTNSANLGDSFSVSFISVKSLAGNHATQSTSASRPTLGRHPRRGVVNQLTRTQEFDNAVWTKGDASITANAVAAPDGTLTADKLVEAATTGQHRVLQSRATTAADHTFSLYAKAGERAWLFLQCDNPVFSRYFDLSLGALGAATGTGSAAIEDAGDGWWKCSVTIAAVAATPAFYAMTATADGESLYAGDGTSGLYIWGAQLEVGSSASTYQRVVQTYDVIEDSRTRRNLLTYTDDFDNAVWEKLSAGSATAPVVTPNYSVAPDGTTTAARLQASISGTTVGDYSLVQNPLASNDKPGTHTASLWVKSNTGGSQTAYFRVSGADTISTATVTSEWTRISVSVTGDIAKYLTIGCRGSANPNTSIDISIWHPQLEQAATATDYQPVTTWYSAAEVDAGAGRHIYYLWLDGVDDYMTIPGSASTFKFMHDGTGGLFAGAVQFGAVADPNALYVAAGSHDGNATSVGFRLGYDDRSASSRNNALNFVAANGSAFAVNGIVNDLLTPNAGIVLRSSYKSQTGNDALAFQNGASIYSAAEAATPSTASSGHDMHLFRLPNTSFYMTGKFYGGLFCDTIPNASVLAQIDRFWTLIAGISL